MGSRKKKKKFEDFKKIKLKAGRKIPKHLNETKPEFTAKKIQIKPITSQSSLDPLKLLSGSQLNTHLKLLYLNKLNEQLSVMSNLSQGGEQVQVISKYLTDNDERVRSEAIRCLKVCFDLLAKNSSTKAFAPIFTIILTFINCGITHINESIRKDSQKLLAFIIDKCDTSMDCQLMQMFLSKINASFMNSLDIDYYRLLDKFVSILRKRTSASTDAELDNIKSVTNVCQELNWSTSHYCIDLHSPFTLDKRYSNIQSFNLTFQNNTEHTSTNEQFYKRVREMVVKDVRMLIGKQSGRTISQGEGQKAISALQITLALGLQHEVWPEQSESPVSVPHVTITQPATRAANRKVEHKTTTHIQYQINCLLNKFRKLLQ